MHTNNFKLLFLQFLQISSQLDCVVNNDNIFNACKELQIQINSAIEKIRNKQQASNIEIDECIKLESLKIHNNVLLKIYEDNSSCYTDLLKENSYDLLQLYAYISNKLYSKMKD